MLHINHLQHCLNFQEIHSSINNLRYMTFLFGLPLLKKTKIYSNILAL